MSMRRRPKEKQDDLWIATADLARTPGHVFYDRLNAVLAEARFDSSVEELCRPFYADGKGRPSIPPGVYMRMLLIGFFEGLDSERGIAWRCADSLSLRKFLGFGLSEQTPDHSSLSRIRSRLSLEVHQEVFTLVLKVLAEKGLVKGRTIGIDASTMEANAALRSIVRRDDGTSYQAFLTAIAKESGIETPTRADLAKLDRKRKSKGSNDDWTNPNDPDAKITKLKDGRTHLAHKAEHAVDMDTGAVLAVTVQDPTLGDPTTMKQTIAATVENVMAVHRDPRMEGTISERGLTEWVADKGYHSNETMEMVDQCGLRSYVSEPRRKRRDWRNRASAKAGTYANRRRLRTARGKRLLRRRGELLERSFAHSLETGGMRRVHLRGRVKIRKRYLIHVAAQNLGLLMRSLIGFGTPKGLAGRFAAASGALRWLWTLVTLQVELAFAALFDFAAISRQISTAPGRGWRVTSSTGC